jgi:UPF0716 protein FxsA
MPLILLSLFIAVPIVEIVVIIKVGGLIGAWPTVGLIFLTAIAGTALVRAQGFQILARAQDSLARGQFPAEELFDGMNLLAAGILLLTPGFVTDAFGLVLLVPPLRRRIAGWIWRRLLTSGHVHMHARWQGPGGRGDIIEGDYTEVRPAPPDGTGGPRPPDSIDGLRPPADDGRRR